MVGYSESVAASGDGATTGTSAAWPEMPEAIRAGIVAMVKAARS